MSDGVKPRSLAACRTLAALILFVVCNIVIFGYIKEESKRQLTSDVVSESPNEKRQKGSWVWWVSRNYLKEHSNADIALMGSSQMSAPIYASEPEHIKAEVDCVTDKESKMLSDLIKSKIGVKPETYLFAMGGAMVSDHYLLAKALFNEEHKPKMVIVGLNPRDFMDNTVPSVSSTEPFFFLAPFVNLDNLADCTYSDPLDKLEWSINKHLPIMLLGKNLKENISDLGKHISNTVALTLTGKSYFENEDPATAKVASAEDKTDILNAIYGKEAEVEPGTWLLKPGSSYNFVNNMNEYQKRYKNPYPGLYQAQKRYFKAFMQDMKDKKIEVLVVGMPSLWPNRKLLPDEFWKDFNGFLASTCSEYGGSFIDLSADKKFNNRCYIDTVHLNRKGGDILLKELAREISSNKQLAASLKAVRPSIAGKEESANWH